LSLVRGCRRARLPLRALRQCEFGLIVLQPGILFFL
jgi:hypothetical protein